MFEHFSWFPPEPDQAAAGSGAAERPGRDEGRVRGSGRVGAVRSRGEDMNSVNRICSMQRTGNKAQLIGLSLADAQRELMERVTGGRGFSSESHAETQRDACSVKEDVTNGQTPPLTSMEHILSLNGHHHNNLLLAALSDLKNWSPPEVVACVL